MKRTLPCVLALVVLAGCGSSNDASETAMVPDTAAATAAAPGPVSPGTLTDPQIAAIVVAANQVDIQAGELARTKATDPQVKQFAERMITDHTGVNQKASQLVQRLGVTPEPNPTSEQLLQGGEQSRNELQGMSGAAFDKAYIDREVAYHQQVLDAIDGALIPNAKNPELKALIEQVRPAIQAHLQLAQQIQSSLGQA